MKGEGGMEEGKGRVYKTSMVRRQTDQRPFLIQIKNQGWGFPMVCMGFGLLA
jgi:hypothetical protein